MPAAGTSPVLDWMSSVAPEKLVASTWAEPRWTVTAAAGLPPAFTAGGSDLAMRRPRPASGNDLAMTAAAP